MSDTMLKSLADPQSTSGFRARSRNVRLASDTARIFTTNARSLTEWVDGRFVITQPVRRKMIVFVVNEALVEPDWATRPDYDGHEI